MNEPSRHGSEQETILRLDLELESVQSIPAKIWEFIKLHFTTNQLEKYILEHEANDCSMIAKFHSTITLDLSNVDQVSVDSLTLNTVRMPHPLVAYLKKHPQFDRAQVDQELSESPVVLFIHGLGGQMSQFEPLMGLLSQCLEILLLDLPGFGASRLSYNESHKSITEILPVDKQKIQESVAKMSWLDYNTESLVAILTQYVHQSVPESKKLVLIGHSMGTHLATKLVNNLPAHKVEGMILLSPPPFLSDEEDFKPDDKDSKQNDNNNNEDNEDNVDKDDASNHTKTHKIVTTAHRHPLLVNLFTYFPFVFNSFRIWDRINGLNSTSVLRQLIPKTGVYNKVRQFRWNLDVDSRIVLRYFHGFHRAYYSELCSAIQSYNNNTKDKKTYIRTLFIGGSSDKVTPSKCLFDAEANINKQLGRVVTKAIEVSNVGHSLLLIKPEFISGTIISFIEQNYPARLHLLPAWVLQQKALISGDKWGLKNEMKWQALQPISTNIWREIDIAGSDGGKRKEIAPLLGMKTLREGDANHLPKILELKFYDDHGKPKKRDEDPIGTLIGVVDISHDIPPYSPSSFEYVRYYKCATVLKVVPDQGAIRRFIQLIDEIIEESPAKDPLVVVHCHYGFNRTGYLICCYLVEKLGWTVHEAVEGYKRAKSPGIKHQHFIDALYVRYES